MLQTVKYRDADGNWIDFVLPTSFTKNQGTRLLLARIHELEQIVSELEITVSALREYVNGG